MANIVLHNRPEDDALAFTLRDLVAVGFRRRRLLLRTFLAILVGALAVALFLPRYESESEILVQRDRLDPPVSADQQIGSQVNRATVTEEDLNSEAQLLASDDLLHQVVLDNGLQKRHLFWTAQKYDDEDVAHAVRKLGKDLKIEPIRKSNVIQITYSSNDPELANSVLRSLTTHYLGKHAAVHRPTGQVEFFDQQTNKFRQQLAEAQAKLAAFANKEDVVSPNDQAGVYVQKLGDLNVTLQQTRSAISETNNRIRALQAEMAVTPTRKTTQLRSADNPQLMQNLKSTLLTLQLKRTDLLTKYDPSYRLVREVDEQIAQAQGAIAAEEKAPLRDETTDQDTTYEWIRGELAKAKADLKAYQAREAATAQGIATFKQAALKLDTQGINQDNLARDAKTAEDNYLLYLRKGEEARISDALDKSRIVNVAVAEAPTKPVLPARPFWFLTLVGVLFSMVVSSGTVFVAEYLEPAFRSPRELQGVLQLPVLAAVPRLDAENKSE